MKKKIVRYRFSCALAQRRFFLLLHKCSFRTLTPSLCLHLSSFKMHFTLCCLSHRNFHAFCTFGRSEMIFVWHFVGKSSRNGVERTPSLNNRYDFDTKHVNRVEHNAMRLLNALKVKQNCHMKMADLFSCLVVGYLFRFISLKRKTNSGPKTFRASKQCHFDRNNA